MRDRKKYWTSAVRSPGSESLKARKAFKGRVEKVKKESEKEAIRC